MAAPAVRPPRGIGSPGFNLRLRATNREDKRIRLRVGMFIGGLDLRNWSQGMSLVRPFAKANF